MRITVVGGTGLIGTRVVRSAAGRRSRCRDGGASDGCRCVHRRRTGGCAGRGAEVVIDVSNSSYTDEAAAREYFYASTTEPAHLRRRSGRHRIMSPSRWSGPTGWRGPRAGYFIAKQQQERLIATSGRAYSLVHATQFFEFVRSIADQALQARAYRLPDLRVRPMAADDVAAAVVECRARGAEQPDHRSTPARSSSVCARSPSWTFDIATTNEKSLPDPLGTYFGARLSGDELLPGRTRTIWPEAYHDWRCIAVARGRRPRAIMEGPLAPSRGPTRA